MIIMVVLVGEIEPQLQQIMHHPKQEMAPPKKKAIFELQEKMDLEFEELEFEDNELRNQVQIKREDGRVLKICDCLYSCDLR